MESKHALFFFCSLLIASLISSCFADYGRAFPYDVLDPNDPYVVELGKFAVSEHNKIASTHLVFLKVDYAKVSIFFHHKYILTIEANTPSDDVNHAAAKKVPSVYHATVFDSPAEKLRRLVKFE